MARSMKEAESLREYENNNESNNSDIGELEENEEPPTKKMLLTND